jgi:hypothetical protein
LLPHRRLPPRSGGGFDLDALRALVVALHSNRVSSTYGLPDSQPVPFRLRKGLAGTIRLSASAREGIMARADAVAVAAHGAVVFRAVRGPDPLDALFAIGVLAVGVLQPEAAPELLAATAAYGGLRTVAACRR